MLTMNWRLGLNIIGVFLLSLSPGCSKQDVLPDVYVYGHAGTTLYPERWIFPANTRESVEYALDVLDADGVEVDVQMTLDGTLVLYHDPTFDEHSNFTGCVGSYTYEEINDLEVYYTRCQLVDLKTIMDLTMNRKKRIFLDMKPYDFCKGENRSYEQIDSSLNSCLSGYSQSQKQKVCVNSRNLDLLMQISDSSVIKSLETEDISLGISAFSGGLVDELCLNYTALTQTTSDQLKNNGIYFSVFGVKTHQEISDAIKLGPLRIVTDNIAYTKKLSE